MIVNNTLLKNNSPKVKHYIWVIFIISLLFPFNFANKFSIYNFFDIYSIVDFDHFHSNDVLKKTNNIEQNIDFSFQKIVYSSWHDIIIELWMFSSIFVIFAKILSYFIFKKKIGNKIIKDKRVNDIFEKCKKDLNVNKNINLIMPKKYISPAIIGIFQPKIIISNEILKLNDDGIRSIFMHELSHYKRKDNITYWILNILAVVYWFNPIIHFLINCVRNNIEYSADEMAVTNMNEDERKEYCRTIVNVAEISYDENILAIGFLRKNILKRRVKYILEPNENIYDKKLLTIFLPIISSFIIVIFFTPTTYSSDDNMDVYLKTSSNASNIIQLKSDNIKLILDEDDNITIWNENNLKMMCENLATDEKVFDDYIVLNFEKGEYIYKINDSTINIEIE